MPERSDESQIFHPFSFGVCTASLADQWSSCATRARKRNVHFLRGDQCARAGRPPVRARSLRHHAVLKVVLEQKTL